MTAVDEKSKTKTTTGVGGETTPKGQHHHHHNHDLFTTIFDLVDSVIELFLGRVIKPFVKLHETFYSALNVTLRKILDNNHIPTWFTANFITYFRTALVIPTLLLIANQRCLFASIICISVDFGDFLDGVVARYWVDMNNAIKKKKNDDVKDDRPPSPANSDDDSFEVVSTGSPHTVLSWVKTQRNRSYGGFVDAVMDKAYVIPTWTILLSTVPSSSFLHFLQYFTLCFLMLAETAGGSIRFMAYFTAPGVVAPKVEGFDFSTSAVKADHVGKAKQTFEMVGTSLFLISATRYIGLILLMLAVPLSYESVRRKVKRRVIYVHSNENETFDHKTLKFWMQAKGMGSKLIVGIPGPADDSSSKKTDMVLNACACSCVDEVLVEAPTKIDLLFLEKQGIDFVVASAGQAKYVTDEVINENCCLTIGEDCVARPMKKAPGKSD